MATRFESLDGKLSLGCRFAAKGGARLHLTNDERLDLFSMNDEDELGGDSAMWTAGELKDLFFQMAKNGQLATMEDLQRWGKKSLEESLHFQSETRMFLDKDGNLGEHTLFKRQ